MNKSLDSLVSIITLFSLADDLRAIWITSKATRLPPLLTVISR